MFVSSGYVIGGDVPYQSEMLFPKKDSSESRPIMKEDFRKYFYGSSRVIWYKCNISALVSVGIENGSRPWHAN